MRNTHERAGALLRAVTCALLALVITTPATAQFGGLKKKAKAAAGQEAATEAQKSAGVSEAPTGDPAPAGNAAGGTVVLTPDVVDKLVAGLKAAQGVRDAARKENTSYGRYHQALAAYEVAKPKCQAGQQTYPNRLAADEKMQARSQTFVDKMLAAQQKGDTAGVRAWGDSAMALQDPNCLVHEPNRPNDYYEAQREVDSRAEKTAIKTSGLTAAEWAMGLERGEGIVRGNPPPDASASEKSAVDARAGELKPLLGIQDARAERAQKPAPAAQPAPAQPAATAVPPGSSEMANCMAKNAQKHTKEIEALGERAKAAEQAGDMARTLAIADTLRQLQMAGCPADN
jgi:hypothetical protein